MRQLYREYSSEEMDSHEISEVLKRMGEIFTGALSVKAGAVESLVEGDENFRRENWEQAAVFYQSALESWPELEEASEGLEKAAENIGGRSLTQWKLTCRKKSMRRPWKSWSTDLLF